MTDSPSLQFDEAATLAFLEHLWPEGLPEGEALVISGQQPGGKVENRAASTLEEAAAIAGWCVTAGAHCWVNVATRPAGFHRRGGLADCITVPGLWADLDVAEGAPEGVHKGEAAFATLADAHAFLERMPLPFSMLVHTGYGLSAWWTFDEPLPAAEAGPLVAALKATVARVSADRADPSVYEVARMMRAPGTWNLKVGGTPRPVTILAESEWRYSATDLIDALDAPVEVEAAPAAGLGAQPKGTGLPGQDYASQATTETILALVLAHGATEVERYTDRSSGRLVVKVARPGKDAKDGHSATIGWVAEAVLHVFSGDWSGLPKGSYDPFRLFGLLEYGGDFNAAARALALQGFGTRQAPPLERLPLLDGLHVAEAFVEDLGTDAIYANGIGWMVWDGRRYVIDPEGHAVMRRCKQFAKALAAKGAEVAANSGDPASKEMTNLVKAAKGYLERAARRNLVEDAAADLAIPSERLDTHPHLLNVENGVVDLRTGTLSDHDPGLRMTKVCAAPWVPGATSPDWTKVLAPLGEDVGHYLQVAAGLSSVGVAVADLILVAHGTGGNGKTTILKAIENALGDYGQTVPAKLFTDAGTRETQLLMPLRGARMALGAETGQDHYLNMERLKALSGGDRITDRYLYSRSQATWDPTHTLWLMTNYRPRVRNTDDGTWRRLQLIPFGQQFKDEAQGRDIGLRDRLQSDPANRTAVLAWLVQGAREWLQEGRLPFSVEVDRANTEWRDQEDVVVQFLRDAGYEVTGKAEDWVGARDLYASYKRWAEDDGRRIMGSTAWVAELTRYGEQRRQAGLRGGLVHGRRNTGARWTGVRRLTEIELAGREEPATWLPAPPMETSAPTAPEVPQEDEEAPTLLGGSDEEVPW